MRAPPLLIADTVPAINVERIPIPPGTRVLILWDKMPRWQIGHALAIETVSGWRVLCDYRPLGSLMIEGTDWRGQTQTMPVDPASIRIPKESTP